MYSVSQRQVEEDEALPDVYPTSGKSPQMLVNRPAQKYFA
jgi:hypothetical protein